VLIEKRFQTLCTNPFLADDTKFLNRSFYLHRSNRFERLIPARTRLDAVVSSRCLRLQRPYLFLFKLLLDMLLLTIMFLFSVDSDSLSYFKSQSHCCA